MFLLKERVIVCPLNYLLRSPYWTTKIQPTQSLKSVYFFLILCHKMSWLCQITCCWKTELPHNRRAGRDCLKAARPLWHFSPLCFCNLFLYTKTKESHQISKKCPCTPREGYYQLKCTHSFLQLLFFRKRYLLGSQRGKTVSFEGFCTVRLFYNLFKSEINWSCWQILAFCCR